MEKEYDTTQFYAGDPPVVGSCRTFRICTLRSTLTTNGGYARKLGACSQKQKTINIMVLPLNDISKPVPVTLKKHGMCLTKYR
jgi:hypothetical protein